MAASENVSDETYNKFHDVLASYALVTTKSDKKITDKGIGKMAKQCCPDISQGMDIAFNGVSKRKPLDLTRANETALLEKFGAEYARKHKKCENPQCKFVETLKPAVVEGTKTSATGNVDGMTDTSKYTGSHKERFDDSGKGKGIDGREERHSNDGYVGQYKGKGTYDKK